MDNDYSGNRNYPQARAFDLDDPNRRPIDDTSNLLTDEHLNLLKNIKLEPTESFASEEPEQLNTPKALQQNHNDNQNKVESTTIQTTSVAQETTRTKTPVEAEASVEEKCDEESNQKGNRKSHHHHHHHKKKKSQKKQKKKSKEHRRKHKNTDKHQNELITSSTQKLQTDINLSTGHQQKTQQPQTQHQHQHNQNQQQQQKHHQSQQQDKQTLPATRSSKHAKSLSQYQTIGEEEPVLSPEDKENFCRAIGVVPTESLLHLHNNHNTSNELDSSVQEHNNDLSLNPAVTAIKREKDCSTIYDMAPATNMKLPGRQTNNSLSSLTGNIFIPTTLQDSTTATSTSTSATSSSASATTQQQQSLKDTNKTKSSTMANNKKQKSSDNTNAAVKNTGGVKRKTSHTIATIKPEAEKEREDFTAAKSNVSSSQNSEKSADE